ncbi:QRIC2 protein, partial [Sclerurus mexicanus]|nr:QRIC2 protein [Sclerurus mexicanus]
DKELLQSMELRVSKIQGHCEELSFLSGSLQKDCEQKQKDIEMLFQSLETLKKDKADEENVLAAIDVKADKAALGSKVSCTQFESSMERLEERMQKMQSQVSGQNQHWNKVQQQLSDEMENKLDRQEMKAFHEQIEDTWQRSLEELENRLKADSAAGYKK